MGLFRKKPKSPMSRDEFGGAVQARIARAGSDVHYDPERFQISREHGGLNLCNFYTRCLAAEERDRESVIEHAAQSYFETDINDIDEKLSEWRERVLPFVWSRGDWEWLRAEGKTWTRPLGDHHVVGVLIDLPTTVMYPPATSLNDWGVTGQEALAVAIERLRAMESRPMEEATPGVFVSPWQDSHDCARLLLPEMFNRLKLKGEPVAVAAMRDSLFVTGSQDEKGLRVVYGVAQEAWSQAYPVSLRPLVLRNMQWQSWVPEPGHPAMDVMRQSVIMQAARDYEHQREKLDESHAAEGKDIFLASYSVGKTPEGQVLSYCVWGNGVHAWLPRTDAIALTDSPGPEGQTWFVQWETAEQIVGHLMTKIDTYPSRYEVTGFPSTDEIKRMTG